MSKESVIKGVIGGVQFVPLLECVCVQLIGHRCAGNSCSLEVACCSLAEYIEKGIVK